MTREQIKNFELLKRGDTSALANIHATYSRSIFWVGKRIVDDNFIVENLVQDSFLKLWVNRDKIETPKHIFFFLRMVMQRGCFSHHTTPRNKFFRKVRSLESYENFLDYLAGYDPSDNSESLKDHDLDQKAFEKIKSVLPLLNAEKKHLIELCLKYGFHYKLISQLTGKSTTETSNLVKWAINDIKNIINQESLHQEKKKPTTVIKIQGKMTAGQEKVFQLRFKQKQSFASIAKELNLSQKEVHKEFMAAYKLMQEKHQQQQTV